MSVVTDIAKFNFEIGSNDTKAVAFKLREKGTRNSPDCSTFSFKLEITSPDYTPFPDLICDSGHPDADWSKAIIIAEFTPYDVTSIVGTWKAELIMTTTVEAKAVAILTIDVIPR